MLVYNFDEFKFFFRRFKKQGCFIECGDKMKAIAGIGSLFLTIITSVILILMGIVYFMLTMWMIKVGAAWAGFSSISGDMVVLTAGIVAAAAMIGSAIKK